MIVMIYQDNYYKNHDFIMIIMTSQRSIYLILFFHKTDLSLFVFIYYRQ